MPRLSGTVKAGQEPAPTAYVQIQNLSGDFQGEVRADDEGKFVLYPSPGRWRLVSWLAGAGRGEHEIEVSSGDLEVELSLS